MYTPKRTRDAERAIRDQAVTAMDTDSPLEVPVGIAVEFYCATKRRTDGDNLLKLVTDALNKVVYDDDHLIHDYRARVHRGVGAQEARTEVSVWVLHQSQRLDH